MISAARELSYSSVSSLNFKLSFSRLMPRNSKAVIVICEGNIQVLSKLFKFKQAEISDILSNGSSLLHVWLPHYDFSSSDLRIALAARNKKTAMVEFLLRNGANSNTANIYDE